MNKPSKNQPNRGQRAPKNGARRNGAALEGLTKTEYVVLLWLSEGKRNAEIATILDRSSRTVEKNVAKILAKLGVETRGAACRFIVDHHVAKGTAVPRPESPTKAPRRSKIRQA